MYIYFAVVHACTIARHIYNIYININIVVFALLLYAEKKKSALKKKKPKKHAPTAQARPANSMSTHTITQCGINVMFRV